LRVSAPEAARPLASNSSLRVGQGVRLELRVNTFSKRDMRSGSLLKDFFNLFPFFINQRTAETLNIVSPCMRAEASRQVPDASSRLRSRFLARSRMNRCVSPETSCADSSIARHRSSPGLMRIRRTKRAPSGFDARWTRSTSPAGPSLSASRLRTPPRTWKRILIMADSVL